MKNNYHLGFNIGKAKYVVSFHNGIKTHNDGSPFYDIEIFSNRNKVDSFIATLSKKGYIEKI